MAELLLYLLLLLQTIGNLLSVALILAEVGEHLLPDVSKDGIAYLFPR